jgi:exodeoxyribonuclease VIII
MNAITNVTLEPGIYPDISNADYHAGPGISKSGLWTIYTKSPAHYRFGEREDNPTFDLGTAIHTAILEPNKFEGSVLKGPADRRGNKWTDAVAEAANSGRLLLTAGDYEAALTVRDAVHADAWVNAIITGGKPMVEHSAYAADPATGVMRRCRPDLHRADLGVMLDVKSALSAHPDDFARAVTNYGYHAQEAFYTDTFRDAGGSIEAFCFLVVEKKAPFAFAVYELPPSIVEEGRVAMRKTLDLYAECEAKNHWPAYGSGVQELSFKRWAYRETEAPVDEQEAA